MELGLKDKVALVTGGGRGIGKSIALALAAEGVHVAVCGRDREVLDKTVAEVEATGVRALAVVADLLVPADCDRLVEQTVAGLGRLDILVNNASTNVDAHAKDLESLSDDELMERVMVKGVGSVRCTRAAIEHLRAAGGGTVILLGGTSARVVPGPGGGFAGGLGNAFVGYFSKRLSAELAKDKITVNLIHPGETRTDRYPARIEALATKLGVSYAEAEVAKAATIPVGRMVEPEDVAALAVFLSSSAATAITGQTIAVDGGFTPTVIY
jgi:3-oxoacyl-[acyl-carrier protein] reductase